MRKMPMLMTALAPVLLLAAGLDAAIAQHGAAGQRPVPPGAQAPQGDLDRLRDRLCERDGTCDYDQDRDQDRDRDTLGDQDRDRDRDQDRLHTARLVDDQFAALNLLSDEERARFHNEMRNATTAEERDRIRSQHQQTIQERAREMGIDAPGGAPLGYEARSRYMLMSMVTQQERAQFMSRMRSAQTAQEREQIRNEMHAMARERAHEMGIDVPQWYGESQGRR